MVTPFSYYDLLEKFPQAGCAVCNLLLRDADQHMDSILYEYVTDADTVYGFRGSRGFCNEHGWQLMNYIGGKLGAALLYQGALDEVLKILKADDKKLFARKNIAEKLAPQNECLVCHAQNRSEKMYIEIFTQSLSDEKFQTAYRHSDGLCLPHVRQALSQKNVDASLLTAIQRDIWTKTYGEVEEFILHSAFLDDKEKWMRVVRQLCGEKGVFGARK